MAQRQILTQPGTPPFASALEAWVKSPKGKFASALSRVLTVVGLCSLALDHVGVKSTPQTNKKAYLFFLILARSHFHNLCDA